MIMTNATFFNFTDEPFTGYWNGKPKTFKAKERMYMPRYLAEHFAKHLTNRELVKVGKESYTSPKKPLEVPQFMEIFNKAFIADEVSDGQNELDAEISSVQHKAPAPSMDIEVKQPARIDNGPASASAKDADPLIPTGEETGPGREPQVISTPDGDSDDENFDLPGTK